MDHIYTYYHRHHHLALRLVFGPQPPRCRGLEAVEFVRGEDVSPMPTPIWRATVSLFVRHNTQNPSGSQEPPTDLPISLVHTSFVTLLNMPSVSWRYLRRRPNITGITKCRRLKSAWKVTAREYKTLFKKT
jgi:hypothetical protein